MANKSDYLRVPITMPEDMISFLNDFSLKAKMGGGRKIAHTDIVRAAVRYLMELGVDPAGCKSEEDLLEMMKS